MRLAEDVPKLSMAQLRRLPEWPLIVAGRGASLVLEGVDAPVDVQIYEAEARIGGRYWLRCTRCGTKHRVLYLVAGVLACRRCHGLGYFEQQAARCRWKGEVLIPALRRIRGLRGAT